ncbi:MAG: DUF1707 domain-containing protein [Planctomycetota bacterium]|jgi:hypothetical protein
MVDREARDKTAELLRHFAAGRITNDEFEDGLPSKSKDPAIGGICWAAWFLYDDLKEHKLIRRHAVTKDGKRHIARWVVFLKSDLEYEWDDSTVFTGLLLSTLLLIIGIIGPVTLLAGHWLLGSTFLGAMIFLGTGLLWIRKRSRKRNVKQVELDTIWPFYRNEDFQRVRPNPIYLKGQLRGIWE